MDAHVTGRYLNGKKPNLERVPHTFAHFPCVRNSVHIHRPHGEQRSGRFCWESGSTSSTPIHTARRGAGATRRFCGKTGNVAKFVRDIAGNRPPDATGF
jgi:hypothetical protein